MSSITTGVWPFHDRVLERLRAVPGVQNAAIAQNPPLAGGLLRSVLMEGADTTTKDRVLVQVNTVSSGYFQTMGISILRGRDFNDTDIVRGRWSVVPLVPP